MAAPPERIDGVPYLKGHFVTQIFQQCHGDTIDCVLTKLGTCTTPKELGELVRACCRNARAGQTLDNGYVVPTINARAAVALLELLIQRPQYLKYLSTDKIQHHIDRIHASRSSR